MGRGGRIRTTRTFLNHLIMPSVNRPNNPEQHKRTGYPGQARHGSGVSPGNGAVAPESCPCCPKKSDRPGSSIRSGGISEAQVPVPVSRFLPTWQDVAEPESLRRVMSELSLLLLLMLSLSASPRLNDGLGANSSDSGLSTVVSNRLRSSVGKRLSEYISKGVEHVRRTEITKRMKRGNRMIDKRCDFGGFASTNRKCVLTLKICFPSTVLMVTASVRRRGGLDFHRQHFLFLSAIPLVF